MRNPALFTVLVSSWLAVGGSHVAAAPDDRESTARVSYTDQGEPAQDTPRPAAADGWRELADPTPGKYGKVFISVDPDAGPFTRLRLDATKGRPRIERVRVDYKHGGSRMVRVAAKLDARKKKPTYVDLGGPRELAQIVVFTDRGSGGMYTVHATRRDIAAEAVAAR